MTSYSKPKHPLIEHSWIKLYVNIQVDIDWSGGLWGVVRNRSLSHAYHCKLVKFASVETMQFTCAKKLCLFPLRFRDSLLWEEQWLKTMQTSRVNAWSASSIGKATGKTTDLVGENYWEPTSFDKSLWSSSETRKQGWKILLLDSRKIVLPSISFFKNSHFPNRLLMINPHEVLQIGVPLFLAYVGLIMAVQTLEQTHDKN